MRPAICPICGGPGKYVGIGNWVQCDARCDQSTAPPSPPRVTFGAPIIGVPGVPELPCNHRSSYWKHRDGRCPEAACSLPPVRFCPDCQREVATP